jgi:CDP-glucose 4,6-dehydratase
MSFNEFYKGKTVLVTGHTGFKGSWLSVWLRELGANVIGYSLDPINDKDNYVLSELGDKITDIRGDIKDFNKLTQVFKDYKPEIVFHMAAQPLVRLSYDIPRQTFEDNVMGTVNVLECVRHTDSVQVCVNITSDKCYDNKEWIWGYKETDAMGGYDPYSASKGCSELVVNSYINSFFNTESYTTHKKAIVSVRAGNVIGGGDWSIDRIIPDCIRALEENRPINVRSPKAVRPWQHVLEPLSGYLYIGSKVSTNPSKYSGGWNFGPNNESIITVEEMVKHLLNNFNGGSWIDSSLPNQLHEAKLLNLDCSKAYFLLGWKPTLGIVQAINLTADWYKRYSTGNVYNLCTEQIQHYTNIAVEVNNDWAH